MNGADVLWGGLIGIAIGLVTGAPFGASRPAQSGDCADLKKEANRPAIVRTYESMRSDRIWVEDANSRVSGVEKFISLDEYLTKFKNEYDRQIEEARIKKLAGW